MQHAPSAWSADPALTDVSPPAPTTPGRAAASWLTLSRERLALGAVLLLSVFLNFFGLGQNGFPNTYYAAAVKSMLMSWHNFFFVSFDPGGFVSVDKPPLGFWIQTASAKLFGFSAFSVLLPQALAGVLSVALLWYLIRKPFGLVAGVLAALTLALTPIYVAVDRNNTIDSLLILTLLGAVWAGLRATERSSLRWLILSMVLVGLGFNIKMLQAYLVVPALVLLYFLGARLRWPTRIAHLAVAGIVLLVVSLSWAVAVDLTPASERPYVGSSADNSVTNLIVGYNGLSRLLPGGLMGNRNTGEAGADGGAAAATNVMQDMPGGGETGPAGPLRLFNRQISGQISWLLPLAALGLVVAWFQSRTRLPLNDTHQSLLLWGMWLVTAAGFFSVAGFFHRYYLAMLAPPIAALVGIGLVALWQDYRATGWRGWLLPAVIVGTVALQVSILTPFPEWSAWLSPLILVLGGVAAAGLAVARLGQTGFSRIIRRAVPALAVAGLTAMLLAPATWAGYTTWNSGSMLPSAGPADPEGYGMFGPGGFGGSTNQTANSDASDPAAGATRASTGMPPGMGAVADPQLVAFLQENRGGARFLLGAMNAMSSSALILTTGEPVAALGGFIGSDPILTDDALQTMIANGEIRYFLVPKTDPAADGAAAEPIAASASDASASSADETNPAQLMTMMQGLMNGNGRWINTHCTEVPAAEWESPAAAAEAEGSPFGRMNVLFDCQGATS